MPPILKKFSNEIIKNIARNIVINNNVDNISNNKKLHRRQDGLDKTTDDDDEPNDEEPNPVASIPTITITTGPLTFTLSTAVPTDGTDDTDTDIEPTVDPTDIDAAPTATATPTDISAAPTGTAPIDTDVLPTITPTDTSTNVQPISTITTLTQTPLSSSSTSPLSTTTSSSFPPPIPGSPNNKDLNNLLKWLIPTLAILLLIIILAFLVFIYRKRKRKRNTVSDIQNIGNIGAGDITDKDKGNGSKTNSLTSSIHSTSSFKIRKGKVVPEDINAGSPVIGSPIIEVDNIVEAKPKMPTLKRTPTTVSAFKEMVDLTEDESNSLRHSLNNTPASSSNAVNVIPLHQERVNVIIPFSIVNQSGGSGSGSRTFRTPDNDDDDDDDK